MTADAVGGIWTYAVDLAGALRPLGVEVTLAVVGPGLDAGKRQAARDLTVVDLGHPPEWLAEGPGAVARGAAALAALAREVGADLVHLNHPAFGAGASFACPVLAVGHSCVATWWAAVRGTPLPQEFAWQADCVAAGYRAATAVAVPSQAFAAATAETYGLSTAPAVISNGRTAAGVAPDDADPIAGAITVGRLWDEGKDAATLDRAAALTSVPIRAVGPTRGANGATVALRHMQVSGVLSDAEVRGALAARPVYLSAARYEPFGLSVLEAAQAGCALVLSDIPTFRELWGDAAILVQAGDAGAFAAALDRLIHDPVQRARAGAAARHRAARFSLDAAAQRVAGLYAAMLDGVSAHGSGTGRAPVSVRGEAV